jgi:hypothetical protein
MFIFEKNSRAKNEENLDSPSILAISLSKAWNFLGDVRFMKGVHDDISQTFSNFYQGMMRPYHGTMPSVMFLKHLFHFSIVEKPMNDVFVVDYCHSFS